MKLKSELLTTEEIVRALRRIAHQIVEKNEGTSDVVVLGILSGGVPIAKQLADYLMSIEGEHVPCGVLDICNHRDDIGKLNDDGMRVVRKKSTKTEMPCDINGKHVILVDDVLYTGRTARAAFDALSDYGRAGTIQLAVLIDRGHRELPIRADYVGKNIPTSHTETIRVEFDETGMKPTVNLYEL